MDNKQGRSRFSRYLLLFLLSGVFMLGSSVMAEVLTVKVMSYNTALIRGGTEQDISSLAALIQSEAPAIINIQELGSANRNLSQHEGRFKENDYVLLLAFGGGLTWGGALLKW